MLNELLLVERGAREAGLEAPERHQALKDVRRLPTLIVRLGAEGQIDSLQPLPRDVKPWTLRDGQQNSFPFVQNVPLALPVLPQDEAFREKALERKADASTRREALLDLLARRADAEPVDWPGARLVQRLQERRQELLALTGGPGGGVLAAVEGFLRAVDPRQGGDSGRFLASLSERLAADLRESAQDDWLEVAVALLIGERQKTTSTWASTGALLFEAAQADLPIFDARVAQAVSQALRQTEKPGREQEGDVATCGLTGVPARLLSGSFPQPNLPVLGQTFLFSRNPDIKAQARYRRSASASMPVGIDTVIRLRAAFEALTSAGRKGVTWRPIPGEAPQQNDLLLAFVIGAPDLPAAWILGHDEGEEDFSEESAETTEAVSADSIAVFEKRTRRAIEALDAKVGADFRTTPVQVNVFRSVDPANRKAVYAGTATVANLYEAAMSWAAGERNVPAWLTLPIFRKKERQPHDAAPPHIAPLGLIRFSRQLFVRHGKERQEVTGLPAAEALALFLEPVEGSRPARRRVERVFRLVLRQRGALVATAAHEQRRRGTKGQIDLQETLRTITVLGLLLHKAGRIKEDYMSDTAFKLGQLLAAADVVHAGYCADVRGGALPPSLLGNQVFTLAQSAPEKALATLCRRWKPYEGWAAKAARDRSRPTELIASKKETDQDRGWDIKKALRHAREMKPLAAELAEILKGCKPDDAFRAELLLGYIAGLPPKPAHETEADDQLDDTTGQEN